MILRTSVRIAPRRAWNVSTWRSTSAAVSLLPASSLIFGSLLDDLQQEFLRGFVVWGGNERIEHVTAARRALAPGGEGGGRPAQAARRAIARFVGCARRAEQRRRLIVLAQCERHAKFTQRVFGTVVGQQALAE